MDDIQNLVATKNFSLTIRHIGLLRDMEDRTGKSASELARVALERLYEQMDEAFPPAAELHYQPSGSTTAG